MGFLSLHLSFIFTKLEGDIDNRHDTHITKLCGKLISWNDTNAQWLQSFIKSFILLLNENGLLQGFIYPTFDIEVNKKCTHQTVLYGCIIIRVSHTLNNWVDGVSVEAYYPWESPKKIRLKSVNPTFASEQKKVSIHQ